jgi:hypothetical protein
MSNSKTVMCNKTFGLFLGPSSASALVQCKIMVPERRPDRVSVATDGEFTVGSHRATIVEGARASMFVLGAKQSLQGLFQCFILF